VIVPDPLPNLIDDLNYAFNELGAVAAAGDEPSVRRKLAAYLDALYDLREYRSAQLNKAARNAQLNKAARKDFWERIVRQGKVPGGRHVEGHLVPRGNKAHSMIKLPPPAVAPLYPSDRLMPSDHLYPGENLTWKQLDELDQPTRREVMQWDGDHYFEEFLAGLPVLPAADIARRCLIDWDGFARLTDSTYIAGL
jgi:hypothetical protein